MPERTGPGRLVNQTVSWRVGSLWPYESMAGVGAKCCYVNRISPRQFRLFLCKFCPSFKSADFLALVDHPDFSIRKFSLALGEPVERIRQLRLIPFFPPEEYVARRSQPWPINTVHGVPQEVRQNLVYCPACAKVGFHASFHQLARLSECPIHGLTLEQFAMRPAVRKYLRSDEKLIADAYELLFHGSTEWDFRNDNAWMPATQLPDWRSIARYLELVRGAKAKSIELGRDCVIQGGANHVNARNSVDLLRWLHWPRSIPRGVERWLPQEPVRAVQRTIHIDDKVEADQSLSVALREIQFASDLPNAWQQWAHLLGEVTTWHKMAHRCIDEMLTGHVGCWISFTRFRGRPDTVPQSTIDAEIRRICPRVVAVQGMQERWLTPWHLVPWMRTIESFDGTEPYFGRLGRELEKRGLADRFEVELIHHDPDGMSRVFHQEVWRPRDELRNLLDTVLEAELMDEVWNWWQEEVDLMCSDSGVSREKTAYGTNWYLLRASPEMNELRMWTRTPRQMPNWISVNALNHRGEERLWKWMTLKRLSRNGQLSRDVQWKNPHESERIAMLNWETKGKAAVFGF